MQTFQLSTKSENVKLGKIATSISNSKTCPSACPFKNNGCYAAQGPMNWIWKSLDRGYQKRNGKTFKFGTDWKGFVKQVKELPRGKLFRFNQAGDLPGVSNIIHRKKLNELIDAATGLKAWTYTHKPVKDSPFAESNKEAIKDANERGFTINLSANSLKEADELKALNIAPVVSVVSSHFTETKGVTKGGNRFVVCPAQTIEGMTCEKCQLCQKQRSILVVFRSHGMAKNKVNLISQ